MKLELKHIAPYLPYKLWLQYVINDVVQSTGIMKSINHNDCENHPTKVDINYQGEDHIWMFRPILRPMSDLTKEIEINGKNFIPIMVLFGGEDYKRYDYTIDIIDRPILGQRIDISVKDLGSPSVTFGLTNPINNMLDYQSWQLLFEWHFDVFNLIPQGLAIDIKTLK